MKNHFLVFFIVFIVFGNSWAQEAIPFKTQNEFYIYGDATVIGNNILSKDAVKPFNDPSLVNDDIDMVYVDVDNDESTFSSSSAKLNLPNNFSKIKYAVLYWSATYSYEQGYRQESGGQFLFQGKRVTNRKTVDKVKFKLPNGNYKDINGKVIFDGADDTAFTLNSPYVCMADVTRLLRNADNLNGEYTVANINATKGFVSGGSAAGWLLYVVYEAPTKNAKYITTYNGFAHVSGNPVKLKFKNFKALEKGDVSTSVTFAALEGDSALKEDECIVINSVSKRVALLSTNERPRNNFFNSKITKDDELFNERLPNSENTLGFDIISKDISNDSQPIVDNNTTEIEMAFNTESDRFYLFFTAFQTEISETFYQENKEDNDTEDIAEINQDEAKKLATAESEKQNKLRIERDKKEKADKERADKEKAERERKKKEKAKREQVEKEEKERADKAEKEKAKKEKAQREKADRERAEKEQKEKEREESARAEKERLKKEKQEKEKREKAKREREKKEKADRERAEKEKAKEENTLKVITSTPTKTNATSPNIKPITTPIFTPKEEAVTQTPVEEYKPNREDKPLPIWLQKKATTAVKTDNNVYRPEGMGVPQNRSENALVLNRENYEKVLVPEDYVYETQSFKRVLNQEPTYIEGMEKGYYIIASLTSDLDESIAYQNELKRKDVNSKMFKDIPNSKYYLYLYNSENFYDVFMLRKAFVKSVFLKDVWILNININEKIMKKL